MDEPILMKLYTVEVYNLTLCIKEDNSDLKIIREIIRRRTLFVLDGRVSFVI